MLKIVTTIGLILAVGVLAINAAPRAPASEPSNRATVGTGVIDPAAMERGAARDLPVLDHPLH